MTTDVWTWLRSCRTCGEPHQHRILQTWNDQILRSTWADPDDGHPYIPRVNPAELDRLQAAYQRELSEAA